ncbi:MAG TPA: VanZ-like protein [Prevotella sp.]|nr:VanZ-like protein [Prevotella sp.]
MNKPYDFLKEYPLSWICTAIIWVLCLIPIPETPLSDISMIDKWTHFVMYGGLCLIVWGEHAYRNATLSKRFLWTWAFAAPLVMGGLVEVVQATCTGGRRSGDVVDWLADGIGVLIGQVLGMLLARVAASCRKGRKADGSCGNAHRP